VANEPRVRCFTRFSDVSRPRHGRGIGRALVAYSVSTDPALSGTCPDIWEAGERSRLVRVLDFTAMEPKRVGLRQVLCAGGSESLPLVRVGLGGWEMTTVWPKLAGPFRQYVPPGPATDIGSPPERHTTCEPYRPRPSSSAGHVVRRRQLHEPSRRSARSGPAESSPDEGSGNRRGPWPLT